MGYTNPTTRTTGELITASIWNTDIVDNIRALKSPPSDFYTTNEATDYTTVSTSFVAIDTVLLSLDITPTGTEIFVGFFGAFKSAATSLIALELYINGVAHATNDGITGATVSTSTSSFGFVRLVSGLTAGVALTIKLYWKVSASTGTLYAGAGTASNDFHPQFWAREVS